jgi:hypothetical protein
MNAVMMWNGVSNFLVIFLFFSIYYFRVDSLFELIQSVAPLSSHFEGQSRQTLARVGEVWIVDKSTVFARQIYNNAIKRSDRLSHNECL